MSQDNFDIFYNSTGICTDTRKIEKDSLFICIKGENFDGNTFASKAIEAGAKHVVVDNSEFFVDNSQMTLVDDSVKYLQSLANHHRKQFDIPVIGITGSNGKTTTKELINAVLSKKYNVLATVGNLNNHLGVPFTLLKINDSHDIAIIEMGANKFKDIEELCAIAEPTVGIITNIGKAHLEGFIDFQGVLNTKRELYESISSVAGEIVVNSDDDTLNSILPLNTRNYTYGTKENCIAKGILLELTPFVEMNWSTNSYTSPTLTTQMVGKYNFYNYLAAICFGIKFQVENDAISAAIVEYSPTNNRSQVKKTSKNTLILDCYNANPTSMKSALESFAMNNHTDKLFILGDMKELGPDSHNEHVKIISLAEKLNLSGYVVGDEFNTITSSSILKNFKTTSELEDYITTNPMEEKLLLLKGSRSIGLEKLENSL